MTDETPEDPARDALAAHRGKLDRKALEALVCPVTRGLLIYEPKTQELCRRARGSPIRSATASR